MVPLLLILPPILIAKFPRAVGDVVGTHHAIAVVHRVSYAVQNLIRYDLHVAS